MNKNQRTYLYGSGWKHREVTIQVGLLYEVQPLNPNKNRRNRGRICVVLGFRGKQSSFGEQTDEQVKIKWQDDNQIVFIDPTDLIPVKRAEVLCCKKASKKS